MSTAAQNESDIIQVEGIYSKGFGLAPKLVMQDQRISVIGKAIYCYFCSYAGAGKIAFPRLSKVVYDLKISKDTFYAHFKPLKKYGFIKVNQSRVDGKHSHNVYTIMENVPVDEENENKPFSPCPKIPDTVLPDTVLPDTILPDTVSSDTVLPDTVLSDTVKPDTNNNSNYKNNSSKNNNIEKYPPNPPQAGDGRAEKKDSKLPSASNQSCADLENPLSLRNHQSSENLMLNTGGGEDENTSSQSMTLTEQRFEEFWAAYPRKIARKAVLKTWKRLNPDAGLHARILAAIGLAKATEQWQRENGRYIPNPQTWISQGRWDDVYPSQIPQIRRESNALSRLMAQIEADESAQDNEIWGGCE